MKHLLLVLVLSVASHAAVNDSVVQFHSVEPVLDLYQGESKCTEILEEKYGEGALIQVGKLKETIDHVCDFE